MTSHGPLGSGPLIRELDKIKAGANYLRGCGSGECAVEGDGGGWRIARHAANGSGTISLIASLTLEHKFIDLSELCPRPRPMSSCLCDTLLKS